MIYGQDSANNRAICQSRLNPKDAVAVTGYLMTLKDPKVKPGTFHKEGFTRFMLEITIFNQLACNACHIFPCKGGGRSGASFHTAEEPFKL